MVMTNVHAKYEDCGSKESSYWVDNFFSQGPYDFTFDPVTSESMSHLIIMTKLQAKYEDYGSKESSYWVDKLFV
jgi:hypothetical protein